MDDRERAYYENEYFWRPDQVTAEVRDRIEGTVALIPRDAASVLDAGSGTGVLVAHLLAERDRGRRVVACDRSFAALRQTSGGRCQADIIALPFPSRAFDIVCSLQVIEHIPPLAYRDSLSELCRVARTHVLVSVPNDEDIVARHVTCPSCQSRFNADLHMRRFDRETMRSLLEPFGFACRELTALGGVRLYFGVSRRRQAPPWEYGVMLCPVCGFSGELPEHASGATAARSHDGIRRAMKRVWPYRTRFTHMAALYERVAPGGGKC